MSAGGPALKSGRGLTQEIAAALGLPKNTARAVLTLDVYQPPRLEITMNVTDSAGRFVLEEVPSKFTQGLALRIAKVQFMVRLERFPDAKN